MQWSDFYLSRKQLKITRTINDTPPELFSQLAALVQKDSLTLFNLTGSHFEDINPNTYFLPRNQHIIHPYPHKFCPLCLRKKAYHRKIWDLLIITACPIHKCILQSICPQCNKSLKMSRKFVCKCNCEFDFREVKPIFISDDEFNLAGHIYFLAGLLKTKRKFLSLNNPLINYSLEDFCGIIYYFTKRVFTLHFEKPLHFTKLAAQKNLHLVVCEAFSLFNDFPKNYLIFLESIVKSPNYFKRETSYRYFALYHPDFYKTIPSSCSALLYKVFDENIDELLLKSYREPSHPHFSTLNTAFELADQIGVEVKEIIALASDEDIPANIEFTCENKIRYVFPGDTFINLISNVRTNILNRKIHNNDKLLNLIQISQYLHNYRINLHQFLSLVLQGEIKPYLEDFNAKGLHRFLFLEKDVKKLTLNKLL